MRRGQSDGQADYDLDSTDELPVLDVAEAGAAGEDEDRLASTGEWLLPGAIADAGSGEDPLSTTGEWPPVETGVEVAETVRAGPPDDAIAALTTTLREKSFAIARLERELEASRAEVQRLRRAEPAVLEQRLAEVERERLALAAQHDERRAALASAEELVATLRESLGVVETRLAAREAELAGERARLAAQADEADRLRAELEARTAEAITAEVQRDRERFEARIDELSAALASARDGHMVLARDRDGWRVRESERAAEVRALREELRRAGLQAERLLEQLRSREARRRFDSDFRAPAATPRAPACAPHGFDAEALLPGPAASLPPAAPPARAVLPKRYLVRLDDPSAPLQVLAQERISVGRTPDNDLQLDENWMSRHHAILRLGAEATVVEDSDSTNGVYVNGRRVRRELLHDGDELAFGKARFRFQVHRPAATRD